MMGGEMVRRNVLITVSLGVILFCGALRTNAQERVTLEPTPKTVAWGYYDAKAAPVLRVKSGDMVEIQTLIPSSPKRLCVLSAPRQE